jgi:hypothetical protein
VWDARGRRGFFDPLLVEIRCGGSRCLTRSSRQSTQMPCGAPCSRAGDRHQDRHHLAGPHHRLDRPDR